MLLVAVCMATPVAACASDPGCQGSMDGGYAYDSSMSQGVTDGGMAYDADADAGDAHE